MAGAAVAAPMVVSRSVLGGAGRDAPSEKLRIAAVGIGGMGQNYLRGCAKESIVALCDLDHRLAAKVFETYPKATRYHDFRRLLDREADRFDALIIATPDHTHATIFTAAIELGKHVYCAKPITHNIGEARKIRSMLAAAPHLVTKASVQSSGTEAARSTTELLQAGHIGPVRELHIWCDHPAYPCGLVRPEEEQTPPPGMDWDLWIGPAPYRPYHSAYHPANWRPWWDFGSGTVGDMACHTFHMYFNELRLQEPTVVYSRGSTRHRGFFQYVSTPECQSQANMVTWEFPVRGSLPAMKLHWYDGGMRPHRPDGLDRNLTLPSSGLMFVGEAGILITGYTGGNPFHRRRDGGPGSWRGCAGGLLLPEEKFREVEQPSPTLRRVEDHYGEWTRACKTGARTVCPVEFGCEMTELALLGALSLRTRTLLEWDAAKTKITNDERADELIHPARRAGWEI